jgi:tetratricopeptide (TPR) repeat protein
MKLPIIICCLISLIASSCAQSQDCVDGINKMPLYGNGKVKKCPEQLKFDQEFIATEEKVTTRKAAAAHMIMRGWEFYYKNELDTSVMRFNQAWLLDSLNAELYWGLGDVLGKQQNFRESISFFEHSLKLDPTKPKVWADESVSYGNLFMQSHDVKALDSVIYALKKAIVLSPNNAQYYGQLTSAYSYFMQKDSARKYLEITDKLDPKAIDPQARAMINSK